MFKFLPESIFLGGLGLIVGLFVSVTYAQEINYDTGETGVVLTDLGVSLLDVPEKLASSTLTFSSLAEASSYKRQDQFVSRVEYQLDQINLTLKHIERRLSDKQ